MYETKSIWCDVLLASLQWQLCLVLANGTFETEDNLLRGLCLLVEDGLGLTTITGLFSVITTLSLSEEGSLSSLVLGDFVGTINIQVKWSRKACESMHTKWVFVGKTYVCFLHVFPLQSEDPNQQHISFIISPCKWNLQVRRVLRISVRSVLFTGSTTI